jgi:acetoin utilization deacetylase AcuC-like enzyme
MSQYQVPVVWSADTRLHDPRHEVWVGVATEGTETAGRVDAILGELEAAGHRLLPATPHDDSVLQRVHDENMLDFLATAYQRWQPARTSSWSARTGWCRTSSRRQR